MGAVDWSVLGDLPGVYRQAKVEATRNRVLADLGQSPGGMDFANASKALMAAGDTEGGMKLAQIAQSQAHTNLAQQQFDNTKYTQTPEYIGNVARTKATVDQEFAPKTVDIKTPGAFGDKTITVEKGPNGYRLPTIQGVPSATSAASPTGSGEDFIKSAGLTTPEAELVRKIAKYELLPDKVASLRGDQRLKVLEAVSQYDPTYDAALAPARFAAIKEFNSGGQTSPASIIVAGNTAIQHLKTLSDAGQKIGGASNWGPLNSTLNAGNVMLQGAKNNPDLVEYNNSLGRFTEEATKFYRGIGGSEADIQRALHDVTAAQSPEARNRAIATQADLMQSKINAMQDRWKQANGVNAWNKVTGVGDFPIVQQKSQAALNEILKRDGRQPVAAQTSGQPQPQAGRQAIPFEKAAQMLRANPQLRDQFEQAYPGMAAKVLGQ